MDQTDKRLAIIPKFLASCDTTLITAILLTGSMVFGKHHSVHPESDIDIICLVTPKQLSQVIETYPFTALDISPDLVQAFIKGIIDRFWLDHYVDGIKINVGLWSYDFFKDFTNLQATHHVLGSANAVTQAIDAFTADGIAYQYDPELGSYGDIYTKRFPLWHGDLPVSSPTYNNLIASETLYDSTGACQKKIAHMIQLLNTGYGPTWQEHFLQYVTAKSSNMYLDTLKQRLTVGLS